MWLSWFLFVLLKKSLKYILNSIISNLGVDFGDNVDEFFEANHSVSVLISEVDHLINFGSGEALSNAGGDSLEVLGNEGSTAWSIESLEDGLEGSLISWVLSETEDFEESCEVNISDVSVAVDDVEDLCSLGF